MDNEQTFKEKQKKNTQSITYVIIGALVIALALWGASKNKEKKYESCIEACKSNNQCLKKDFDSSDGSISGRLGKCVEYSEPTCNNICVEKYK